MSAGIQFLDMANKPIIDSTFVARPVMDMLQMGSAQVRQIARGRVVVGTNVGYMAAHQLGRGQRKRRFLGISQEDAQEVREIFRAALPPNSGTAKGVYSAVGEYMLLATDERFEREIDPSGNPWYPNAPGIIAKKRAAGRILKILQETGRGRASINYRVDL